MNRPLKPPTLAAREKHFAEKIAHQRPLPPHTPPTPELPPRIVPDPLKGTK